MPPRTRISPKLARIAIEHLKATDPKLGHVIDRAGEFGLRLQPDPLEMLIRSIVSQQVSTGAARAIFDRVQTIARDRDGHFCIDRLRAAATDELKAAGLSRQKASYVHDLASRVADGRLKLAELSKLENEVIIQQVTQVHGVGIWTAHMFLIFCLGRTDVLPWGDYGVRAAMRNVYGLKDLPDRKQVEKLGKAWNPYESIACWYLWRSLEFR